MMEYKALVDCEWEVKIITSYTGRSYYWTAKTSDSTGAVNIFDCGGRHDSFGGAKLSWPTFAARNGFKKWKFI